MARRRLTAAVVGTLCLSAACSSTSSSTGPPAQSSGGAMSNSGGAMSNSGGLAPSHDGGSFSGVGGTVTVLSATASAAKWAALDGCAAAPGTTALGSVRLSAYSGCRDGSRVELRTLLGAGHAWPADIGEQVADALG